jgi:ABC-type bacteriocin/lantibiotic exporter with double-glycine peptidase domain
MAQTIAAHGEHESAAPRGRNVFAFAWRQSRRHQPWLCLLAALIFPLTMVPLELQRRIVDRAIGNQNLDLLLWLGAIYLAVALLQAGLKYLLRLYRGWSASVPSSVCAGRSDPGAPQGSRARPSRSSPPR